MSDQGSGRAAGLLRLPGRDWKHLRTTNVIESSFATVRHRTVRSKGCLSNKTALAMIFKLAEAAEKVGGVSTVTTNCRKLSSV
jgi:transposase-like protein